ncbi:cupin 2 domain-containing protein [Azospirillaceae bacterium]
MDVKESDLYKVMDGRILRQIPKTLPAELIETLLLFPKVRIEKIVSTGHASLPDVWYDQKEAEWVVILRGAAGVQIEGEAHPRLMGPGDYVYLPPHCRHRVAWTSEEGPTVWLAVFITPD